MASKKTWLITINPNKWDWEGKYQQRVAETKSGMTYTEDWSFSNTHAAIGDDVYLVRLGVEPRGIIAHGIIDSDVRIETEVDEDGKEKKSHRVNIKFDLILDVETDRIVTMDELINLSSEQYWHPQGSGIEIKDAVVDGLNLLWSKCTNNQTENFPSNS